MAIIPHRRKEPLKLGILDCIFLCAGRLILKKRDKGEVWKGLEEQRGQRRKCILPVTRFFCLMGYSLIEL